MTQTVRNWLQQPIVLADALAVLVWLALLAFVLLLLIRSNRASAARKVASGADRPEPLRDRVAAELDAPDLPALAKTVLVGIVVAYGVIFVAALFLGVQILLALMLGAIPGALDGFDARGRLAFGTLIAAILGAPFIIWRSLIAAKQTAVAEESLFNDKINAAATDLAARRQVTKAVAPGGSYKHHQDFWEDDLVTRAAAIDRLEGLAREAFDKNDTSIAQRIARMLSIYVQELSRAHPPKSPPKGATPEALREWARNLTPVRPDMHRAVQSLGRINPHDAAARAAFDPGNIDLRRCNLQAFDLHGLNYQGAQLNAAQMQGADLGGAQMQGAVLWEAQMQGAVLRRAQMQGADLGGAQMQGAVLWEAQMQGAVLRRAQMQGAVLRRAQMQGADLGGAQMSENTDLTAATLRGAAVRSVDDTTLTQLRAHDDWPDIFHPDDDLDYDTFITRWRAFAAALDPPVTIAPDYGP